MASNLIGTALLVEFLGDGIGVEAVFLKEVLKGFRHVRSFLLSTAK